MLKTSCGGGTSSSTTAGASDFFEALPEALLPEPESEPDELPEPESDPDELFGM